MQEVEEREDGGQDFEIEKEEEDNEDAVDAHVRAWINLIIGQYIAGLEEEERAALEKGEAAIHLEGNLVDGVSLRLVRNTEEQSE